MLNSSDEILRQPVISPQAISVNKLDEVAKSDLPETVYGPVILNPISLGEFELQTNDFVMIIRTGSEDFVLSRREGVTNKFRPIFFSRSKFPVWLVSTKVRQLEIDASDDLYCKLDETPIPISIRVLVSYQVTSPLTLISYSAPMHELVARVKVALRKAVVDLQYSELHKNPNLGEQTFSEPDASDMEKRIGIKIISVVVTHQKVDEAIFQAYIERKIREINQPYGEIPPRERMVLEALISVMIKATEVGQPISPQIYELLRSQLPANEKTLSLQLTSNTPSTVLKISTPEAE